MVMIDNYIAYTGEYYEYGGSAFFKQDAGVGQWVG